MAKNSSSSNSRGDLSPTKQSGGSTAGSSAPKEYGDLSPTKQAPAARAKGDKR